MFGLEGKGIPNAATLHPVLYEYATTSRIDETEDVKTKLVLGRTIKNEETTIRR